MPQQCCLLLLPAPRRRYRTQCIVSGLCTVLLVLLLLMQLGTVLSVWGHLQPRWPYLPLVLFQLANLAAVLVVQVGYGGGVHFVWVTLVRVTRHLYGDGNGIGNCGK